MGWKEEQPTKKQLRFIAALMELSEFTLPPFTGTTKGDAADYIDKYKQEVFL